MFAALTSQINVVGDNNTLLYGRVVDVADNGLYIDLLCKERRREFFPFNKVFVSKISEFTEYFRAAESWKTVPVEVLRRENPGGAWRWWPGKIINPLVENVSSWWWICSEAIVQGQDDSGATWTDIFPDHRIRFHVQWDLNVTLPVCIPPGRFVKRSMPLPADCRGISAVQLLQVRNEAKMDQFHVLAWQREPAGQVICFDVVDGQLQYIVDLYDSVTLPQPKDQAQEIVQPLHHSVIQRIPEMRREIADSVERGKIDGYPVLGVDVWQEVFAHLDTVTRTVLRTVCSAWEVILDTPALAADIVVEISGASEYLRCFYYGRYALTAPILKCQRPSTKYVIVRNPDPLARLNSHGIFAVLNLIHYMAGVRPGIHLTALYFVGVKNWVADVGHFLVEPDPTGAEACAVHDPAEVDGAGMPRYDTSHLNHFIAACRVLPCDTIHLVR